MHIGTIYFENPKHAMGYMSFSGDICELVFKRVNAGKERKLSDTFQNMSAFKLLQTCFDMSKIKIFVNIA